MKKTTKAGMLIKKYMELDDLLKEMKINYTGKEKEEFESILVEELLYDCVFAYDYALNDPDATEAFETGLAYEGESPVCISHGDLTIYIAPSKLDEVKTSVLKKLAKSN